VGGTDWQRTRCRERLERLSTSTLDCESIQREAIADIQRLIGFDRWCWPIADPQALLPLGGAAEHDYGPQLARALELEYSGGDFAAKDVLARRARLAGSLSAGTGGDLALSPRWDEVMRGVGIGDVAVVTCRDALGCWGWIEAYCDGGDRPFALGSDASPPVGVTTPRPRRSAAPRLEPTPAKTRFPLRRRECLCSAQICVWSA
jgi:hypothetical protein